MESKRVVRMKNGKYAIQIGYEDREFDCMIWDFEHVNTPEKCERLLFTTEHDAEQYVKKWVDENAISEICVEFYINGEK